MSAMAAHGEYEIQVTGNIQLTRLYGAWNVETSRNYCRTIREQITEQALGKWARIVDLSEWEGGSQEVVNELNQIQTWSAEHGCVAIAYVGPSALSSYLLEKYGSDKSHFQVFTSLSHARDYVATALELQQNIGTPAD